MRTTSSPQQGPASQSEANCVNTSVKGDSWDKKPEDWLEEMMIVDAKAEKPEGAENESFEQLSSARRIDLNKCELLITGRFESAAKLKEFRGNQTALSMKQVCAHRLDQFLQG